MYFGLLSHKWFLQGQLSALSVTGVAMFPALGQSWPMTRLFQDGYRVFLYIPSALNVQKWDIPKRT